MAKKGQKPKNAKARQHDRHKHKYAAQWSRTWKNKVRRIEKNAQTKSIASREIAKAWKAQEIRRG